MGIFAHFMFYLNQTSMHQHEIEVLKAKKYALNATLFVEIRWLHNYNYVMKLLITIGRIKKKSNMANYAFLKFTRMIEKF